MRLAIVAGIATCCLASCASCSSMDPLEREYQRQERKNLQAEYEERCLKMGWTLISQSRRESVCVHPEEARRFLQVLQGTY